MLAGTWLSDVATDPSAPGRSTSENRIVYSIIASSVDVATMAFGSFRARKIEFRSCNRLTLDMADPYAEIADALVEELAERRPPHVVGVGGAVAVGKSTVAEAVSSALVDRGR